MTTTPLGFRKELAPVCVCGRVFPRVDLERARASGANWVSCAQASGGCGSKLSIDALLVSPRGSNRRCHRCHQTIKKKNPHRMDRQKWKVLDAMVQLHQMSHEWIRITEGREIRAGTDVVNTEYRASQHVQRLKWFGLVEHKGRRTALYRVTDMGYKFLKGLVDVPAVIYCREGEVLIESPERVVVSDIKDVVLDKAYWDRYARIQV